MKMWIDPPQGYLHGFPKIYDSENDKPIVEFLEEHGYNDAEWISRHMRMWPAEKTND